MNRQQRDLPLDCDGTILRRLTRADLLRFQAYRADPEVARYQGWEPMADEAALSFLQSNQVAPLFVPGRWNQLGITVAPSDEISGDIGLCLSMDGREVEIGISLERRQQGRGVASRAFTGAVQFVFGSTRAQRVVAVTDSRNTSCIRLLKGCGMRKVDEWIREFRGEDCLEFEFEIGRN